MPRNGLRRGRWLRVSALASAVLMAGCGGGDAKTETAGSTTSSAAQTKASGPTTPTTVAEVVTTVASLSGATTTTAVTGTRSAVSTTIAPTLAPVDITAAFIPEKTVSYEFVQLDMNGVSYKNALQIYYSPGKVEINAGRNRSRFRGVLGIPDSAKSSTTHQVEISFDNAAPVLSVMVKFGETTNIDLDVTNVLRVRISVSSTASSDRSLAIGNPRFS